MYLVGFSPSTHLALHLIISPSVFLLRTFSNNNPFSSIKGKLISSSDSNLHIFSSNNFFQASFLLPMRGVRYNDTPFFVRITSKNKLSST